MKGRLAVLLGCLTGAGAALLLLVYHIPPTLPGILTVLFGLTLLLSGWEGRLAAPAAGHWLSLYALIFGLGFALFALRGADGLPAGFAPQLQGAEQQTLFFNITALVLAGGSVSAFIGMTRRLHWADGPETARENRFWCAAVSPLRRPLLLQGRISRRAYWAFLYLQAVIGLAAFGIFMLIQIMVPGLRIQDFLAVLFISHGLLFLLPNLTAAARRLRDAGRSPRWLAALLIPGGILLLLWMLAQPAEETMR